MFDMESNDREHNKTAELHAPEDHVIHDAVQSKRVRERAQRPPAVWVCALLYRSLEAPVRVCTCVCVSEREFDHVCMVVCVCVHGLVCARKIVCVCMCR